MIQVFLVYSVLSAAFVANALWPIYRPQVPAIVGFFAGWLTLELSVHHLVVQGTVLALGLAGGALDSWPGRVAVGLSVLALAGLAVMTRRSLRAAAHLDGALATVLGPDHRERTPAPRIAPAPPGLLPGWWVPLTPRRPRAVEKVADLVFAEAGGAPLALDLYRHRSRPTGCPVLLQIHGGGWVIGDKREQGLPLMYHLAERGWLCVTANYRLSPPGVFPDALVDLKRAVAWIRQHAAEHGGDPAFLAVTGESAGGHLAALLALTANDPRYQPGFESVDTTVQACVPVYGIYDLADRDGVWPHDGLRGLMERRFLKVRHADRPEVFDEASPLCRLHRDAPPFLVVHGDRDALAPVAGARRFVRAYQEVTGRPAGYAELHGAQHAFEIFPSIRALAAVEAMGRFLAAIHAGGGRPPDPETA